MIEKICYILIGIIAYNIIKLIILNAYIDKFNTRITKIYNYFAVTIILVGFTSYKTVSIIRASKNDRLTTFISENLIEDSHIFSSENKTFYIDNLPANNKVITYYYLVSLAMITSSLLLAFTFSYLSELFTDKNFDNPFGNKNLRMLKKGILFVTIEIAVSKRSVILQKGLTPFNVSTIQSTSVLIVTIALVVSYMVIARGNEIVKE